MNTFFTSDLHLGHFNIISYCNRPFKTLDEMNNILINRWNERVKPEDFVYHLGDFCFKNSYDGDNGVKITAEDWIRKLNGHKIFVQGNHDRNNSLKCRLISGVYDWGNKRFWICHNPIHVNYNYEINLVGHVHEKWKKKKMVKNFGDEDNPILIETLAINVGVDVWNFYPKTIEELLYE